MVALDTLRLASNASLVIQGIELINKFRSDPAGGQRARDFMHKYHNAETVAAIPRGLWDELTHMAALHNQQIKPEHPDSPHSKASTSAGTLTKPTTMTPNSKSSAGAGGPKQAPSSAASGTAPSATSESPSKAVTPTSGFKRARRT